MRLENTLYHLQLSHCDKDKPREVCNHQDERSLDYDSVEIVDYVELGHQRLDNI